LGAGKEIHWIEWGLGGGASQDGRTPARTALEAAYWPYWGIFRYSPQADPWSNPEVQGYLLHYINATSAYLLQVGRREGQQAPLQAMTALLLGSQAAHSRLFFLKACMRSHHAPVMDQNPTA
jgi:hypothetical protein